MYSPITQSSVKLEAGAKKLTVVLGKTARAVAYFSTKPGCIAATGATETEALVNLQQQIRRKKG